MALPDQRTGGLTQDQWRDLEDNFHRHETPPATDRDMAKAPIVTAVTIAGSDAGILVNIELDKSHTRFIYLNAIAALALGQDIGGAGQEQGWWNEGLAYQRNPDLPFPKSNDAATADHVISLVSVAAPDGLFVKFLLSKETITLAINKRIAMELMLGTLTNAKRYGWLAQEQ